MDVNKCSRGSFNRYVDFMLSIAHFKRVFDSSDFVIVESPVTKQQYGICKKDGVVVGYVFHGKLVVPEEVT